MSAGKFNRLDRPEDRTKRDRFEQYKADTSAWIRYREAYHAAAQAGVPLAELPHPDAVGTNEAEVEGALALLAALRDRSVEGRLKGVPGPDIMG